MSDQPFEIEKKKQSEIRTEEKKEQKESPYKAVSLPPQEKSVSGERKAPKKADEKKAREKVKKEMPPIAGNPIEMPKEGEREGQQENQNRIIEEEPKEEIVYRGGEVERLSPEEIAAGRKIYNDKDKEVHMASFCRLLGIDKKAAPKERNDLVLIRQKFMHQTTMIDGKGKERADYDWNDDVDQELRAEFDWLMEYYKINDPTFAEFIDEKLVELPVNKKLNASVKGLEQIYEKQGINNCFCCAGTAMLNQFLRNKKGQKAAKRYYSQYDMRNFSPRVKKYSNDFAFFADEGDYKKRVTEVSRFAGKGKYSVGNVFELGDFFYEELKKNNAMLNKMIFKMPQLNGKDQKADSIKASNAREAFKRKIAEIINTGNVVGFLDFTGTVADSDGSIKETGHYVTITGIHGDEIEYLDSNKKDFNKVQHKSVDEFLYRIDDGSKQFEIDWISEMKKPEAMKKEYSDLDYHAKTGYSVKRLSDENVLNVAHTKGLTVRKTLNDLATGVESEVAYIPNPGMKVSTAPMEEYVIPEEELITTFINQEEPKKTRTKEKIKEAGLKGTKEESEEETRYIVSLEKESEKKQRKKPVSKTRTVNEEKKQVRELKLLPDADAESLDVFRRLDNKKYDKTMERIMNQAVRTGFTITKDLPKEKRLLYDLDNTLSDVKDIKDLIFCLEDKHYVRADRELAIARLSAVQGRNLSHLLLNDKKTFGDSKAMKRVKEAIRDLEELLTSEKKRQLTSKEMDEIAGLYRTAMEECQKYCDEKTSTRETGSRRRAMVEATLKRLTREAELFELGRQALRADGDEAGTVRSGMALLSYAALSDYTYRLKNTNRLRKAETEKDDLKREAEMKQAAYGALEKKYNALKEKKEEEYGSLAIIRIPFDSELNDLKIKLEARAKDLESTNEKLEKLSGVKEDLLKAQEEREEKRRIKAEENKSKGARRIRKELEKLPNDLRLIAYTLDNGYGPSYLFKDPKKPTSAEKRAMRELINARKALSTLEPGSPKAVTVRVHGHFVRFLSDQFGNLMMQSEGHSLSLSLRGDQIADNFSKDVFERPEIYGEGDVREIIESQKTDLSSMNRGELLRSREYCARVLHKKTGIAMNLLNNVPVSELKNAALIALDKNTDRKKLISTFTRYVERQNTRHRDVHINTVLNLELQKVGKGSTDGVKLLYEDMEEESGWREEEELVRDFAADLMFSEDTWVSDGMKKEPALRMRNLLLRHSRAISLIISDQFRNKEKQPEGLVTGMVEKLPIFAFSEGGGDELKGKLEEALEQVRAFVEKMVDARIKEMKLGSFAEGAAKAVAKGKLMDPKEVQKVIEEKLPALDAKELKELSNVDKYIDDAVKNTMDEVQQVFDKSVEMIFGNAKEKKEETEEKEKKDDGISNFEVIETSPLLAANRKYAETEGKNKLLKQRFDSETAELSELKYRIQKENLTLAALLLQGRNKDIKTRSKQDIKGVNNSKAIRKTKSDIQKLFEAREKLLKQNDVTKEELKRNEEELLSAKKAVEAEAKKERMNNIRIRIRNREEKKPALLMDIQRKNEAIELKNKEVDDLTKEKAELDKQVNALRDQADQLLFKLTEIDREYNKKKKLEKKEREKKEGKKASAEEDIDPRANPLHVPVEQEAQALMPRINEGKKQLSEKDERLKALKVELKKLKESVHAAEKELKELPEKSVQELEDILNATTKGKKGQGLFMKNVFQTYFKNVPVMDQRSMLAGAIRNAKPVPRLTKKERDKLSSEDRMDLMTSMLGGMFKGAGPLFQKMLQGIPMGKDFPRGLKKAIQDTQDSLASIPEEVVRAHMDGIIERSNGRIQKIEVGKSLGAASVGQAFLCTVYGKRELKGGKQVVIKLLRPDARNRMMREKQVMLNAARLTDEAEMLPAEIEAMRKKNQIGGMEATYLGNLQRIEEELDLTREAENCRLGAVYDKPAMDYETKKEKPNMCDAMKLSDLAEPTSDTCVMEIAGSMTVKKYLSDIKEKGDRALLPFLKMEDEVRDGKKTGRKIPAKDKEGKYSIREDLTAIEDRELSEIKQELIRTANELDKKQKALCQVAQKWVTEGIFEAGYYHGDLHAGNIMISDPGVTIIDFGNATRLSSDQQEKISKLMMAATFSDVGDFRHAFHALLENTPEEIYEAKRDELTLIFTEILSMGSEKDAALRISVALAKAQEIGLELPPTIANFVSCQMRLQNTIKEANDTLKGLQNNIDLIDDDVDNIDLRDKEGLERDVVARLMKNTKEITRADDFKLECKLELAKREVITKEEFLALISGKPEAASVLMTPDYSDIMRQITAEKEKGEKADKKKIEELENQLYNGYRVKTEKDSKIDAAAYYLALFPLIPRGYKHKRTELGEFEMEKVRKEGDIDEFRWIVEKAYNKTNGKELMEEFEKLEILMKESIKSNSEIKKNSQAMQEGVKKLSTLLWQAQTYRLHEMYDNAKDKEEDESDREPDEFVNVMGEVLSSYKGSLAWRLGIIQGYKVKKALKKVEKRMEEEEDEEEEK